MRTSRRGRLLRGGDPAGLRGGTAGAAPDWIGVRYTGAGLAGRRREMEEVSRLLGRARAGTGGLLVFAGPAGSGKTYLAEAAAGEARRRGSPVELVVSRSGRREEGFFPALGGLVR